MESMRSGNLWIGLCAPIFVYILIPWFPVEVIPILACVLVLALGETAGSIGLQWPRSSSLPGGFACIFGVWGCLWGRIMGAAVAALLDWPPSDGSCIIEFDTIAWFGRAVVAGPVAEEIYFRGFLMECLWRRWGMVTAVFISSAWFALAHIGTYADPGSITFCFICGLSLAMVRVHTGSILPGIAAHSMTNALGWVIRNFIAE